MSDRTEGPIPPPRDDDDEDVHWALSTSGALWGRGERAEALRWLRRAAETASDANAEMRALELMKAAADVTGLMQAQSAQSVPPRAATTTSTPPPPPTRAATTTSTPPPGPQRTAPSAHLAPANPNQTPPGSRGTPVPPLGRNTGRPPPPPARSAGQRNSTTPNPPGAAPASLRAGAPHAPPSARETPRHSVPAPAPAPTSGRPSPPQRAGQGPNSVRARRASQARIAPTSTRAGEPRATAKTPLHGFFIDDESTRVFAGRRAPLDDGAGDAADAADAAAPAATSDPVGTALLATTAAIPLSRARAGHAAPPEPDAEATATELPRTDNPWGDATDADANATGFVQVAAADVRAFRVAVGPSEARGELRVTVLPGNGPAPAGTTAAILIASTPAEAELLARLLATAAGTPRR